MTPASPDRPRLQCPHPRCCAALPCSSWHHSSDVVRSMFSPVQSPPVLRDPDGVMRGATVDEERGLSYADENLFRRDVRRWTALREMA